MKLMSSRFDFLCWPPWSPVRPQWLSPGTTGQMSPSRRSQVRRSGLCSWSGRRWQQPIWLCWCQTAGRTWAGRTQSGSASGPALSPLELFNTKTKIYFDRIMAFIFCMCSPLLYRIWQKADAMATGLNTAEISPHHWSWAASRCRGSGWCW